MIRDIYKTQKDLRREVKAPERAKQLNASYSTGFFSDLVSSATSSEWYFSFNAASDLSSFHLLNSACSHLYT